MKPSWWFLVALVGGCGPDEGAPTFPIDAEARVADPRVAEIGDRWIVVLKDPVRGLAAVHAAGGHVALALPREHAVAAYLPAAAVAGLARHPAVDLVEPDVRRVPLAETVPYGIGLVHADLVPAPASPAAVTVCVIDSGLARTHEDLAGNAVVTASPDVGTGDPLVDTCGHGTHVSGTIAAVGDNGVGVVGVNPDGDTRLHVVKVFDGEACGWAYSSTLIKALSACRSSTTGRLVVSMSLGGSLKSRTEQAAFDDAWAAGVLSVAAAGNDGTTRLSYPASYPSVISVAAVDAAATVASFSQRNAEVDLAAPGVAVTSTVPWASVNTVTSGGVTYAANPIEHAAETHGVTGALVDGGLCTSAGAWSGKVVLCDRGSVSFLTKLSAVRSGGGVAAVIYNNVDGGFSGTLGEGNTSPIPAVSLARADGLTLVATGLGRSTTVVSWQDPGSGYEAWNGTSMATPHVSGVAALLWKHAGGATNVGLRDALTATARDLGAAGRDDAYGHGLVQADAALARLGGGPSCTATGPTETACADGVDDDCDGLVDADDPDCAPLGCDLAAVGEACTVASDCCTGVCKGRAGRKTCR